LTVWLEHLLRPALTAVYRLSALSNGHFTVDIAFHPPGETARVEDPSIVATGPAMTAATPNPQTPPLNVSETWGLLSLGTISLGGNWHPDWKKGDSYPDPIKTSPLEWAWQFLRRNLEYQQLWSERIAPVYNSALVDLSLRRVGETGQLMSTPVRKSRDEIDLGQDLGLFRDRFGIVTVPPAPSEPKARIRFAAQFIHYASGPHVPGQSHRGIPTNLREFEVLLRFDLQLHVDAQLSNARKLLMETIEQKRQSKAIIPFNFRCRPDKYTRYLRLLDADVAAASDGAIAKVIHPILPNNYPDYYGSRKVREDRAVAESLRDNPWRIAAGAAGRKKPRR
jgi:hypothetical protein